MTRKRTIKAGSDALLVYPAGDCDSVTVLSLTPEAVVVRVKGTDKVHVVVEESIGIGVDERLVPVYDAGLCGHVQHRQHRQSLQCQRTIHGPEINHYHGIPLGWVRVDGKIVAPVTNPIAYRAFVEKAGFDK